MIKSSGLRGGYRLLIGCCLALGNVLTTVHASDPRDTKPGGGGAELFVRRIEPLLAAKCFACHGNADEPEGDFTLTNRQALLRGGESGDSAVVPGDPEKSPLVRAVERTDAIVSPMPPKEAEQLSTREVGWLRQWIAAGAPWPDTAEAAAIIRTRADAWSAEDGVAVSTSGGLSAVWTNRRYDPAALWAYRPIVKPKIPTALAEEHPIDALLAMHRPAGLTIAPRADRRTLLRRATFDLTGLPPTLEEMAAFVTDPRDDVPAFKDVIDRLLASPHYGERMAQHWLDVTRYADSSGFANDYERGNAWRYRDYVVRSFNSDKPFDQFVREQIAGDEIAPDDPEAIIATGFLRMGPWELTGMEVEKIARQRFLDDVTNAVGEVFLGHALQCARCHDHKFDPVPTRDYYAIQAVFATTQLAERAAAFLPEENRSGFEERQYLEQSQAAHQQALASLDNTLLDNARLWFEEQGKDPSAWRAAVAEARQRQTDDTRRGGKQLRYSDVFGSARRRLKEQGIPEADYPPKLVGLTPAQFGMERIARKGLERLRWEFDRYEPYALAVYSGVTPSLKNVYAPLRMPTDPLDRGIQEETCILVGGDPFSEGQRVEPGVLSVLHQQAPPPAFPDGDAMAGRRQAFASWVADSQNPLTTRVIVNRIWMWHFGVPLAGNPNNFGGTGKRPTHPELLDWLAATFVEHGWSFKTMHRRIMLSAAYRRRSLHPDPDGLREQDPLGLGYAAFRQRRLTAEEIRDAMLATSGELNPDVGGIPVRPEINLEAALQPRQVMGTFAAAWVPHPLPEQRHRRSLYTLKLRGLRDPRLEVFNAPAPDFSCERRDTSTVTPQVFALFNSRATHARALALATRVLREASSDEAAIERCFELAFGRVARGGEMQACLTHWRQMEVVERDAVYPRHQLPRTVLREAIEENTGVPFTFTETLHANADFVPDLQPADCDVRTRALANVCLVLLNSNEFLHVD